VELLCNGHCSIPPDTKDHTQRVAESWIDGTLSAGVDVLGCARGARESAVGGVG
jgi:hypothetical protein